MLDKGDEAIVSLETFANENCVGAAHFKAIGAFEKATIAYWNRSSAAYEKIEIDEQVEVLSMIGDIGRTENGDVKIHAHVVLGRRDCSTIGGHLMSGVVFPTLELFASVYDDELLRKTDKETKLPLLAV